MSSSTASSSALPEGRRAAAIDLPGDNNTAITAEAVNILVGEIARTDYGMYNDVILTGYDYDRNAVLAKVSKVHVPSPRVVEKENEAVSPWILLGVMLLGRWFCIQS
ncbi:Isocitrate dehydrogenase kinasephosphatase [Trema orientale]|uniref:Isocitrate dehydrogenase kinasephosphatase n=1 Tax=Trema orientale TaxID=63057 RepID=A0A2P5EFG1_TREOI|nr:Isocitrate dehydrogenase kinasephosphatase [Trema orientale]